MSSLKTSALVAGLAAAALAATAAPSHASNPCDKPVPPPSCDGTDPDPGPVNNAPTASFSLDAATAVRGQVVTATDESSDPDGDALSQSWTVDGKAASNPFTFTTNGTHTIRLHVSDGQLTATATKTVQVVNQDPTITLEGPATLKTGEQATYHVTGSDPDGDPLQFVWGSASCRDIVSDGVGDSFTITATSFPTDTLPVCVVGYDGQGAFVRKDLKVKVVNRKPVAQVAVNPAAPVAGDIVTFDSSASTDADGSIVSRAWDTNGDGVFDDGTGMTAQRGYQAAGTYHAALKVTDDQGDATVQDVTVTVAAKPGDGTGTTPPPADTGTGTQPPPAGAGDHGTTPVTPVAPVAPIHPIAPAGPAANTATLKARFSRAGRVKVLKLANASGPITVACKGKGCAFKAKAARSANLKGLFRKALKPGATITVTVGDGTAVAKRTFTVKVKQAGKAKVAIA